MVYKKGGHSRGQAAMEYLMTYGWAILVIVIVLAVLLFLNPFKAPETCLFQQPGFSCSESPPQVYNDGTQVLASMSIYNKFGQSVTIHKVICTTAAIGDVKQDFSGFETSNMSIGAGASGKFTGHDAIPCVGVDGQSPVTLNANAQFKGVIAVWYNFDNDPDQTIYRQAAATLVSTVLAKP